MKNWEQTLVSAGATLHEALGTIDKAGCQIALVIDEQGHLLGTLSDGDVRRALLKGLTLGDRAVAAMHPSPTCARVDEDRQSILGTMRRLGLHQIPIVDRHGVVVGLEVVDDFLTAKVRDHWVVVMAGGIGSRLEDLTRHTPKPMLKVGSRPLLETIVRGCADHGFRHFYFAVNYRSEQIEAHFGDGSELGVEIRYLREQQRLGTAGALSLLSEAPSLPIVVTNADLLTRENYGDMVDRHVESGADATMAVRAYEMQVPFGVVRERDGSIESIEEKPVQRFIVSAGMYVLSPQVLRLVPHGQFFDMPSLFEAMVREGMSARCHHVDGYWIDIGRLSDYERANMEFDKVFQC
ncbi:MAG: nucleotidyltransferase family protein [Proteobacteria bacterium]|nr:nucleotidyltransferase family protein [Pseudomonadota bacterium]